MPPSTNGGSPSASSPSQQQGGEAVSRVPRTDQELAQVRDPPIHSPCLIVGHSFFPPQPRASTCRVRLEMIQLRPQALPGLVVPLPHLVPRDFSPFSLFSSSAPTLTRAVY